MLVFCWRGGLEAACCMGWLMLHVIEGSLTVEAAS